MVRAAACVLHPTFRNHQSQSECVRQACNFRDPGAPVRRSLGPHGAPGGAWGISEMKHIGHAGALAAIALLVTLLAPLPTLAQAPQEGA